MTETTPTLPQSVKDQISVSIGMVTVGVYKSLRQAILNYQEDYRRVYDPEGNYTFPKERSIYAHMKGVTTYASIVNRVHPNGIQLPFSLVFQIIINQDHV